MNKDTLVWAIGGLVVGILLMLLVAPQWGGMMGYRNSMMGQAGNTSQGNRMLGSIDSHFIEQMIPHHEDAIAMAGIAVEKAQHPEIKQLAGDIKRSQTEEIQKMKTWYKSWYGKDVLDGLSNTGHGMGSGMMHTGMMGGEADMEKLKSSQTFDKTFIEDMIPHHQLAVMMAQMLQSSTDRPEMKQLATDIITAQTKEINQMRGWYSQWYGK